MAKMKRLAPVLLLVLLQGVNMTILSAEDAVITLDARKQLFLDDFLIASTKHVQRTIEPAKKFSGNPVLWPSTNEPPMAKS